MIKKIKEIKPLVIGIGVAGQRHLDAQLNLGIKTGVYTTNPKTSELLKQNPNVIVFNSLKDGIKWSNLVHICTPDDKHTEFVVQAVKNGKAVLCEKSFTTSLKDALYLQKLAHRYNSTLIIGHNYRLTPTYLETRKKVLAGKLGTIIGIETTYLHDRADYQKRSTRRKNEDFLFIGGSHAIDLMTWIVNEKITNVQATEKHAKPTVYKIVLQFSSGLLGQITLDASSAQAVSGTDLKVYGEKGHLVSHNKLDKLLFYQTGNKKLQSVKMPNSKTYTTALEVKIIDNYLTGKSDSFWPLPDVDEAVNIMRILDAIEKSAVSKKTVFINYLNPNLPIF